MQAVKGTLDFKDREDVWEAAARVLAEEWAVGGFKFQAYAATFMETSGWKLPLRFETRGYPLFLMLHTLC